MLRQIFKFTWLTLLMIPLDVTYSEDNWTGSTYILTNVL